MRLSCFQSFVLIYNIWTLANMLVGYSSKHQRRFTVSQEGVVMEKTVVHVANFVDRRLHPVRLSIGILSRLIEGNRGGVNVSINRDLLISIASTLEIFIEDFEKNCPVVASSEDKKEKAADGPRVTQSRVS